MNAGGRLAPAARPCSTTIAASARQRGRLRGRGLRLLRLDLGEHQLRVALRVHLGPVLRDPALRVDQEGVALREFHHAHELRQHAEALRDFLRGIREHRER
jgi:hypothetical protein